MSVPQVRSGDAGSARDLGPVPVVNRPSVAGEAGQALGKFAAQQAEQRRKQQIQADQLKAQEAEAAFDREVQQRIDKIDPTAANYDQKVEQAISEARQNALDDVKLETSQVRERLETTLNVTAEQQRTFAFKRRQEGLNKRAQQTFEKQAQAAAAKIRQDPGGFEDYVAEFQAKASEINANLTKNQQKRFADQANATFVEARAIGLAQQGNAKKARSVIEAAGGTLSTSKERALKQRVRGIENQQEQDQLAATQAARNDLELAVTRANSIGELNDLQEQVKADEQGVFKNADGQKTNLQERIIRKKRKLQEKQRQQTSALQNMAAGTIGSQDDADDAWAAFSKKKNLSEASPQERVDAATSFVDQTGWVPSSIKNPIENADRGAGNSDTLAEAAATYTAIRKANPDADTGAMAEGSRVRLTAKLKQDAGLSFDRAAQLVENNVPDRQALKSRREEFEKNIAPNLNSTEAVRDAIAGAEGSMLGFTSDNAAVPRDLRQEFTDAYQAHYELIGDKEQARSAAKEHIQERFSVSRVNGQPTVTRAAPERYVPGKLANDFRRAGRVDLVTKAVRNDVKSQLKKAGVKLPDTKGDQPAFRLVATQQTERQIARDQQPAWQVQVRTDAGFYTPVTVERKDGTETNLKYRMMSATEFQGNSVIQNFRDQQLSEAREEAEDVEGTTRPGQERGQGSGRFRIPGADQPPQQGDVTVGQPEPAEDQPGGASRLGGQSPPGQ